MKFLLSLFACCILNGAVAQVFNYGSENMAFKRMVSNGITFIKTGDPIFDSTMIENLEKYWTISEFTFVERYKKPEKESTALFVTTKKPTKKHMVDRKNQHVLVLQPAAFYHKDKEVPMEQTLGYMYYNGFYGLVEENEEYLFNRYIVQCLNKGLNIIAEKELNNVESMNESISQIIIERAKNPIGNTLLINRELTTHCIDMEKIKSYNITHRLFAKKEFYQSLNTEYNTHYLLYYSVNTKTELSLINVKSGELIYTKQFPEGYIKLKPKELKLIASYF